MNESGRKRAEHLLLDGRHLEAMKLCESLLADFPSDIEALFLMGCAASAAGDWSRAIMAFRKACALAPDIPVLLNNLGFAMMEGAKKSPPVAGASLEDASVILEHALAIDPEYTDSWENLGLVRRAEGRIEEAKVCMSRGLSADHKVVSLWLQLAALHVATYHFDEAAYCYRRASRLGPDDPAEVINRLATVQVYTGDIKDALENFSRAISEAAVFEQKRSYTQNRLFTLHYPFEKHPEEISEEHRNWGMTFFNQSAHATFLNDRTLGRRLRIGYVSPDFRMNAVSFFIQPILAAHNPENVEVFCYANVEKPDIVTGQLQKHPVIWRDIYGIGDQTAFDLIRGDRIDILVELAGHGANNRLPLFALRPAPVQATWIGYPDTTGLQAIDYRITDSLADPPGMTEHLHVEELLRLDPCFLCYRPGDDFPALKEEPQFAGTGVINFGSMSNFSKINPPVLELWGDIMAHLPGSRLVLRYRGGERERIRRNLLGILKKKGVNEERLILLGHANSVVEQLEGYNMIDIALDTFPYNGTTTTCEALFMGAPVVTLAGRSHVSRVGASLLNSVGIGELVASSMEEYASKTLALANDRDMISRYRKNLRRWLLESPLCDNVGAASRLESLYRRIWLRWIREKASRL